MIIFLFNADSSPNILLFLLDEITTFFGFEKAVRLFPSINSTSNKLNNEESVR
ncbi:hypothetical protein D3C87_1382640 [compost metagenome]